MQSWKWAEITQLGFLLPSNTLPHCERPQAPQRPQAICG